MKTIVGGSHVISNDLWALSLIRREGKHHAYLILEGVDKDGERVMQEVHFHIKEGTDGKKGEVTFGDMPIGKLRKVGEKCNSYTWHLTQEQVEKFNSIIISEQKRDYDYVHFGKTKTGGLLGDSLESSGSKQSKQSLENKSGGSSCMDALLRKGHNCLSWAKAVVQALELRTPTSWVSLMVVAPKHELQGTHDGNAPKRCILI